MQQAWPGFERPYGSAWLEGFWPGLATGEPRTLLVAVGDRSDSQIGHPGTFAVLALEAGEQTDHGGRLSRG